MRILDTGEKVGPGHKMEVGCARLMISQPTALPGEEGKDEKEIVQVVTLEHWKLEFVDQCTLIYVCFI